MTSHRTVYPDISDILARKERGRRNLASLPLGEKIQILEAMRERLEPIRRARDRRLNEAAQADPPGERRK